MPTIKRLEESGDYLFVILDYDEVTSLVKIYRIKRVPTYVVLDEHGKEVYRTRHIEDLE